jgi:RNA polymerase sigma-54 factor
MKMGIDLSARQTLGLSQRLAPRMIQSMEILQLPSIELTERIQKELQENPVLELRDTGKTVEAPVENFNPDAPLKHDAPDAGAELEFQRLDEIDRDWGGVFNEDEHRSSRGSIDELGDRKMDVMQNVVERPQSLQDYLAEQLSDLELSAEERAVAMHIITFIDKIGYLGRRNEKDDFLPVSMLEIATSCEPAVSPQRVEDVLMLVQTLDPPGVGARDFRECLLLQLRPDTPQRDLAQVIILEHLEDIAQNRLSQIQKKTGASPEAIQEAIDSIRHLNPKPGSQFASEGTHYVEPDIIIERTDAGEYTVKLTEDWEPRLRIPKKHYAMKKDRAQDPKTREYLQKKLLAAEWLISAIQQRRETITKVTKAIIARQKKFFDLGPEYIEPLKMQQIADDVKVHVTTISRAVDDKWAQTPRGVFPLKRFFVGAATNKETGEQIPWEKVKSALLDMVANEDKVNPLSDEELEIQLQKAGFPVKRRTVTKYRKLLNIASSRERKAWGG